MQRLPKPVFKALQKTIKQGAPLDPDIADAVASAMKDWAIEKGATHFTHLFQPMTGLTAEKHDSFLSADRRRHAPSPSSAARNWSRANRTRQFVPLRRHPRPPSRPAATPPGIRPARRTSSKAPNGATLVIPTAFVQLDRRGARQEDAAAAVDGSAVERRRMRILKLFGNTDAKKVFTTVGPEQEYFLIDKKFFYARPDLINAGRTLFGATPPKGQEMEDQYFGTIPERVLACMADCEAELFKLGVPVKTRHNEVAPSQYEIAPIFEDSNLATDHQMLDDGDHPQDGRRSTAWRACSTRSRSPASTARASTTTGRCPPTTGENLLNPGDTPHDNAQFLVFCVAVIRAVAKYPGIASRVASPVPRNDHRLGANEAPPAIISIFLGDQLQDIIDQLEQGAPKSTKQGGFMEIGVSVLPKLPRDAGDRNRTSPFAFTGNKFEFRAVGSSQSIAGPNTVLNTIVAESLDFIATKLEKATSGRQGPATAAISGSAAGHHQGEQEGPVQRRRLLGRLAQGSREARPAEPEEHRRLAAGHHPQGLDRPVHQVQGLHRRRIEEPVTTSWRELRQDGDDRGQADHATWRQTMILPARLRYQGEVATTVAAVEGRRRRQRQRRRSCSRRLTTRSTTCRRRSATWISALGHHADGELIAHAKHTATSSILPAMNAVRARGRQAGNAGRRRPVAAADVSGDVVYQVTDWRRWNTFLPSPLYSGERGWG